MRIFNERNVFNALFKRVLIKKIQNKKLHPRTAKRLAKFLSQGGAEKLLEKMNAFPKHIQGSFRSDTNLYAAMKEAFKKRGGDFVEWTFAIEPNPEKSKESWLNWF